MDRSIAARIVDWACIDGKPVLEIGPGRGALTGMLAERASRLVLVEIDPRLAGSWRERYRDDDHVAVIEGDVLAVDLEAVVDEPVRVVSNLPYESGTAIVAALLERPAIVAEMVVMLQREVAQRLTASEGSKRYGVLSVMTAIQADVELGLSVAPEAFRPAPRVWSELVRIRPLPGPRHPIADPALFRAIVTTAFEKRRKMLRNNLGPWLTSRVGEPAARAVFAAAGVDPTLRPECVPVASFAAMARELHRLLGAGPGGASRGSGPSGDRSNAG